MALLESVIMRDTRANQPAANAVATGTLFCVTDENNIVERSNGTTWDGYSPTGGGSGDVVGPASSVASEIALFDGVTGKVLKSASGSGFAKVTSGVLSVVSLPATIGIDIDGAGSAITTGYKAWGQAPFAGTITRAVLTSDQAAGSAVVDVWKDTYANFPPTVADSICAAAKPTLSAAQKSEDTTLTGWTTAIAAGDFLAFNIDSVSGGITKLVLTLWVTRS